MRYLFYMRQGTGAESIFYDSEAGDKEYTIASPTLKLELSKAGTLEFTILPTHPMYNNFTKMKTYIRITQDDDEIFRGRVLSIEDTTYMERKIQCEGDLAYLIDSLQPPQSAVAANTTTTPGTNNSKALSNYGDHRYSGNSSKTQSMTTQKIELGAVTNVNSALSAQFAKYINQHNGMVDNEKKFTVGVVNVTTSDEMDFSASGYRDTKSAIDSDLLKQFGGYLQTRKNTGGATYIDWLKEPGTVSEQQIVLGVNLVDLNQEAQGDELFTVFVPIGDSNLTVASVNGGNIGIEDSAGVAKYGRIYKTESYSGISDPSSLLKLGKAYMKTNYKPNKLQLKVKAIDLHLLDGSIEAIKVGSKVTVISEPHGIEESLTCISIEYDIQNPENNEYEIGDPEESLSQKSHAKAIAAEQATASASRSASRANSSASALQAAVNRHADNIVDQANKTYTLEADLAQVHAKCIDINATEYVKVTADEVSILANGKIELNAGSDIIMDAAGKIKFGTAMEITGSKNNATGNACIDIDAELTVSDDFYVMYSEAWFGSTHFDSDGKLHFGDGLYGLVFDESTLGNDSRVYLNGTQVHGAEILGKKYTVINSTATGNAKDLAYAVTAFGTATADSAGKISIPYTRGNGGTGTITFNMADTAWYKARAVSSITASREGNIVDSGSSVSAVYRLHAKNATGADITSSTQMITMAYTPQSADISTNDIQIDASSYEETSHPAGTPALTLGNMVRASTTYVNFKVYVKGTDAVKWYYL